MTSRALRLALFTLCVGLVAGAGYVIWKADAESRTAAAASAAFSDRIHTTTRALLEMKATQPGYVAIGQGDDFWARRMDALRTPVQDSLTWLRAHAQTPRAATELDSATAAFDDILQMDRRAREYARNNQRLLASDLVFSDGIEKVDAAVDGLERARQAEETLLGDLLRERRRLELIAAAGAAAGLLFIVIVLVPVPRVAPAPAAAVPAEPASADRDLPMRLDPPRRSVAPAPAPAAPKAAAAPAPVQAAPVAALPVAAAPAPSVDLQAIAELCTDLSRVLDTRALPGVLERAATLLGASGIVLWIADPDGHELTPILAHGYPPQLLARMGSIRRDAENVTAAAFRTGLVQTVNADTALPGAIAAPLVSPTGTVGVMAAEVRHDTARRDSLRAIAAILAAQLSTLVGPPITRGANSEAAGA